MALAWAMAWLSVAAPQACAQTAGTPAGRASVGARAPTLAEDPVPVLTNAAEPFRLAFMMSQFSGVNEDDARASVKVWIETVARQRGVLADLNAPIYQSLEELLRLVRSRPVHALGMSLREWARIRGEFAFDGFVTGTRKGSPAVEYLLLVRSDSDTRELAQLRRRSLRVLNDARMDLAQIWLDTMLLESGHARTANHFGALVAVQKPSLVVLPVFFGQADACLVPRQVFEVMCELNPQLRKSLRIVAASSPLVPSGLMLRADLSTPQRRTFLEEIGHLHETPAGRQILALAQAERIEYFPISHMDDSLALLEKHERLCAALASKGPQATEARTAKSEQAAATQATRAGGGEAIP